MASRLLAQLSARIGATRDPVESACLHAQRSIYLARQGKRDEAEAVVKSIREAFGTAPNAAVMAWVSLAEALIHFYSQPGTQAMDRLKRAHALSRAMQHPVLWPLCEAWLAHMEFNANRMAPMLQHAREALRLAQPEHHAALARVSLVIADAFHFAGRFDLAKDWYAAVREHALAEGDDAMISAMLHNVAAFRANEVRLADAFGDAMPDEAKRALLETESTHNYDQGIGTLSLALLIPLMRAQLLTATGRYVEAMGIYRGTLECESPENLERRKASFYADRAWCYVKLGDLKSASIDATRASELLAVPADADDLACMHARISSVLLELGRGAEAAKHRELSLQHRARHASGQVELLGQLLGAFPDRSRASVSSKSS